MKSKNNTSQHLALTKFIALSFGLAFAGLSTQSSQADTQTWSGSASGVWDTSALNWDSGAAAWTSSNDALFTGTPANNVTTATGLTIGAITLDNTFTGSVTMTGANTVSGATTISGGTLTLNNATGLGTSAITVNSGGKLALNAASSAVDITYANSVAGAGTVQFLYNSTGNKDLFLNNLGSFTGTIQLSLASGSVSTGGKARLYGATLSGTSSLIIDSGTQLYMGGGNVTLANIQVSGTGNTENRGAIRAQAGTLTGAMSLMGNTTIGTEGGTIAGSISSGASGTQTVTLGTNNSTGNLTLTSDIGGGTGTIALSKITAGTTTLSGTNTYSGGTTITAGTIAAGSNSALGTNSVTFGGGTLASSTNVTLANNLSTASANGNITASGGTMVLNGNITGDRGVTLTPTNKITLAGTNSFATATGGTNTFYALIVNGGAGGVDITGSTTVGTAGAGGASFNGAFAMLGTSALTVQSGGSLTVNGSGTTASNIPNSIIGQNAVGTSTLLVNGGSLTIGADTGFVLGNGNNNNIAANGVLTISSGTVTINRGTVGAANGTDTRLISMGRDSTSATGTVNLNGGTLATNRQFVRDGSSNGQQGTANFVFGGGTLKALGNQTDWLQSTTATSGGQGGGTVNANALELSSVTTTTGTTSTIDANGFSVAINNNISGAGGFNIISSSSPGTSTVTFGGANAYTGATTVSAGTLAVNGNQIAATGAVTVSNSGTRLIGTGTLGASTTTIHSEAIHSAGGAVANVDKVGLQTFDRTGIDTSDLTYGAGSIFEWDLNANSNLAGDRGTGYDGVNVTGTLAVDSTSIFRVVLGSGVTSGAFWESTRTWANIFGGGFTAAGGFDNSLLEIVDTSGGTYDLSTLNSGYHFTVSGTSLTWSAVPEPSSALMGLLVTAGLLRRRRKN
jgi:fibronectin-binding autotransporter adhesin